MAGRDIDGDLAVIAVNTGTTPALPWAADATTSIGTPVFGLANPGGRGLRVTFGFVSGVERSFRGPRGRRITGSVEHTAALLPGSSGGPVLDAGGQLLGINTNRLGEGFYLAIPADETLRSRAGALARGESAAQPQLGVAIAPGHVAKRLRRAVGLPEAEGLLIRDVTEDSPAARAGLAQGDLIVAAGTGPVRTVDDLFDALGAARGGSSRAPDPARRRRADHPGDLRRELTADWNGIGSWPGSGGTRARLHDPPAAVAGPGRRLPVTLIRHGAGHDRFEPGACGEGRSQGPGEEHGGQPADR